MLLALMLQVELLGHDDPDVREAATAKLAAKGDAVEAEVRCAAVSDDPEVSQRARGLLRRIERRRAGRIRFERHVTEAPVNDHYSVDADGGGEQPEDESVAETSKDRRARDLESLIKVLGERPSWSPDGKRVAYVTYDVPAKLEIIAIDGRERRTLTKVGRFNSAPVWSRDGGRLYVVSWDCDLHAVETDGTGSRLIVSVEFRMCIDKLWGVLSTGEVLMSLREADAGECGTDEAPLIAVDPDTGKSRVFSDINIVGGKTAAVSPDGKFVAVVHENRLYVIDANGDDAQVVAEDVAEELRAAWFVPR